MFNYGSTGSFTDSFSGKQRFGAGRWKRMKWVGENCSDKESMQEVQGYNSKDKYLSRFSELMVHKPGEGFLLGLLATTLAQLVSYSSCLISTVPAEFYDKVEEGELKLKKAPSFSFCDNGVLVEGDNVPIEADLVILATGFKSEQKLEDIFISQIFKDYITGSPDAALPLYRSVGHNNMLIQATIKRSAFSKDTTSSRTGILGEYFEYTFVGDEMQMDSRTSGRDIQAIKH
ncbi:Flavin-dependent monooxygenase 1 [Hibiscus syriacus]|uniref:Flavin-dependent monooxygenase 1 n=1 Tax=Hibiscus syriacus TaxID=106335 RepID=A0A6A3ADV0_HIBSY|nr:Flavin-dependent monooxygenase 1 [Hibiscus syriacus]